MLYKLTYTFFSLAVLLFLVGVVSVPNAEAAVKCSNTEVGTIIAYMDLSNCPTGNTPVGGAINDGTQIIYRGLGTTASPFQIQNASVASPLTPATSATPTRPASDQITCNSLGSCVILLTYYVGPALAGNVAYIGAYFFSIVVQLSLNSTAYALDFLSPGWETVRDVANMAFIFILIYIALTVMLAAETSGTIKTLAVVVVIALLVNFSFFFTRIVIDTGNIVAVQFYNAIPYQGSIGNGSNTKDLSLSIMNAVKPQELLNGAMLEKARAATGNNAGAVGVYIVLFLSVAAMLWILFFVFLQVGIKFMLRIVGLWFVLIASPLAFVAQTMPQTKHFFKQWLDYLIKFSFYPAIFLFMFWILTKFTTSILSSGNGGTGNGSLMNALFNTPTGSSVELGTMTAIATVAIRMGFVIAVLYVGLKVSDWIVKEGSATAMKVSGWTTGKAFGAVGWGGRNTFGWAGQRLSETAAMRNWAAKGGILGRTLWRGTGALGRGSFDARGLPGARTALGVLGGDVIKGSRVDVGEASKKSFKESSDARTAWREKEAAALKPGEGQIYKAIGGVVKGLSPENKQRLMNAAGTLAQVKEDRVSGDATSADVKAANAEYKRILTELNIKDKIKEAKAGIGSKNDKKYADSITTLGLHNLFGATSGVPFWIGKADKEAAAKIRGSKNDADQIRNVLKSLKMDVEEGYETPTGPTRAPLTRQAMEKAATKSGGLDAQTIGILKAIEKNTARGPSATSGMSNEQTNLLRRAVKEMRRTGENMSQGFSKLNRTVESSAKETERKIEKHVEKEVEGVKNEILEEGGSNKI